MNVTSSLRRSYLATVVLAHNGLATADGVPTGQVPSRSIQSHAYAAARPHSLRPRVFALAASGKFIRSESLIDKIQLDEYGTNYLVTMCAGFQSLIDKVQQTIVEQDNPIYQKLVSIPNR
jgi:hypothetical protein